MASYALDWLNLIVRWLHFTAGVMWIGTSLYFVWLDNHLRPPAKTSDASRGVLGELWSVHGGGFYHDQKYLTGPKGEPLTFNLHWFKWEAYATWLSGMGLLAIIYWVGAGTYLVDRSVIAFAPSAAIAISIATIVLGWIVYDTLCKLLGRRPLLLGAAVYVFLVLTAWGLFHVFGARAAYIHMGAIIGTIMAANVAFVIIPGQHKMLAEIRAGREPDPQPGLVGKIRSVHNTYFTLPVLFTMISIHYPMTYGNAYGWAILAVIGLAGVLVRYFLILWDAHRVVLALPILAAVLLVGVALAVAPRQYAPAEPESFAQVRPILEKRCAVCHAARPTQPGFFTAPAGVLLDTPEHIHSNARRIFEQAVATHAMPLNNVTGMTDTERTLVAGWIAAGAKVK